MKPMKTESLAAFIANSAKVVDGALERLIPAETVEPKRLHMAIRHSVFAGGKRFRPVLVFAVGEAFGAAEKDLVSAAAAIEMIHTYSLIHDDLPAMDDDDLRRGRPTCHKEFGEATAILAGDVLQTLAFQAVAEDDNLDVAIRIRLISELARASGTPCGMVAGQQMDLDGEGKEIDIGGLESIHRSKTGAIVGVSVRAGAIIGGADDDALEAVTIYASKLGLLFQITDDLLDVTQTTAVLGKTAGKDASVKKATYPSLFGIERTRELAAETHREACEALNSIGNTELLKEIADYVLTRIR